MEQPGAGTRGAGSSDHRGRKSVGPFGDRTRQIGVRVFSSASDAPRARRPTDLVLLALAAVLVGVLSWPAPGPTEADGQITSLIQQLPGLLGGFWEIASDLLLVWALALILMALVAHRRKLLLVDELLAVGLALGFSLLAGEAVGTDWSDSWEAVAASEGPPVYPAVRLALATAVISTASPHMTHALRIVGRSIVFFGAVAAIALNVAAPIGVLAGFIVGIGSAALVHLLVGSPGGRLTLDQVAEALGEIGVEASDLHDEAPQPRGVDLVTATDRDGRRLVVKIFARDAWEGQLLASFWNALWHRDAKPHLRGGRLQLVEHEALVTLLAERGNVPVLPVVATGTAAHGDALLVTEMLGRRFESIDREEVRDDLLRDVWKALGQLHALGLAHGQMDGHRIVIAGGSPALADFGRGRVIATRHEQMTDRAQLLVTMALVVGHERAIHATHGALGDTGLADILPFLQPTVLDREAVHDVGEQNWSLKELRQLAADVVGTEPPELAKIRRVTPGAVAKLILIALLVSGLVGAFAGVDFEEVLDELRSANMWWLLAALAMSPVVQLGQAFSTTGASIHAVSYGPVLMLQYAIQFIALTVPSSAARLALEIRFFQCVGVKAGAATSIGVIDSVSGFAIQIALILIVTLSGLASLDLSASGDASSGSAEPDDSSDVWILLLVLLAIGLIVALVVPGYRRAIRDSVPRYRAMLRDQASEAAAALHVLRSPRKVLYLFGGNLFAQVLLAVILGVCLHAFGHDATLAELILVNTFVSLFAGFMPVPGGIGVAEAGYTVGLEAIGIPSAAAMSTAIAFRLVTFYVPPIWGAIAMRWLRRHSYA